MAIDRDAVKKKIGIQVDLKDNTKKGTNEVVKNANKISKAFSSIKTAIIGTGSLNIGKFVVDATKKSADYIETLNVLDVAFNKNTKSIREFTSTIADTLNLDDASLIKMSAAFKTLANSMSYTEEVGTKFSRLMTQVSLDASSLYNMDIDSMQSIMQSAIQGRGTTLKTRTGVSVLDNTVQNILDTMGIDAYVESMNTAEKAMARVIAITYQMRYAQGDLARTIEAPANQMKVFSQQIAQLGRNIGNVFLPMVAQILPYLNAVLIVLNKLISSLASLVGFREDAWENYKGSAEQLSGAFDDLGTSVSGVGSAAKETKKQLMGLRGFDKLNVIKTPTSAGGTGGGGGTGINPNLLNAFNDIFGSYNSMLDGVKTKATKIAEAIMKAFEEIDFSNLIEAGKRLWEAFKPFAENVGKGLLWTFNNVLKPLAKWTITDLLPIFLDNLADTFIMLNNSIEILKPLGEWLWKSFLKPLAKWTGGTIVKTLRDIESINRKIASNKLISTALTGGVIFATLAKNIGKIVTVLGKSKLYGAISKLISPMKSLYDNTKLYTNLAKKDGGTLIDGIKAGNDAWRKQQGILKEVTDEYGRVSTKLNGITGVINGTKVAVTNLAIAAVGLEAVKVAMNDVSESGINLGNSLGALTGAVTTVSSTMTAGAVFGPYGAAVGAAVGLIGTLIAATQGYQTEAEKMIEKSKEALDTSEKYLKAKQEEKKAIEDNMNNQLAEVGYYERLSNELETIIDSNGKVKKGYEERANFIITTLNDAFGTEYKLIDGTITKNGEVIKSYGEVKKAISDVIQSKKTEIVLEAEKENYYNAIKEQPKAWKDYNDALKQVNETNEKYNNLLDKKAELENKVGTNAFKNYTYQSQVTGETYKGIYAYKQIINDLKTYDTQMTNQQQTMNNYKKVFQNTTDDITYYEDLATANLENNTKRQNELIDERLKKQITSTNEIENTLSNELLYYKDIGDRKIAIMDKTDEQSKKSAYAQYNATIDSLMKQSKSVKDLSPNIINAWGTLASQSETTFLEYFKQLTPDIQQQIVNKMQEQGYSISSELQKGINQINPTIKVKTDISAATENINNLIKKISSNVKISLGSLFKANGGIFVNGAWRDIAQYDTGGLPPVGQMFVARERGPELVGNIGGHTAVMNNNQIVSSVSAGVYQAVRGAMGNVNSGNGVYNIYLDKDHKLGTYTLDQLQQMAKSNGRPITIG